MESGLRKEKESKHKLQSTLSKRIDSLTKQLHALRGKTPKTVIKDLRSREGTPPRAVQVRDIRTHTVWAIRTHTRGLYDEPIGTDLSPMNSGTVRSSLVK